MARAAASLGHPRPSHLICYRRHRRLILHLLRPRRSTSSSPKNEVSRWVECASSACSSSLRRLRAPPTWCVFAPRPRSMLSFTQFIKIAARSRTCHTRGPHAHARIRSMRLCFYLHLLLLGFYARIDVSPFTQVRVRMRRQQCCMDVEVGEHRILRPNQQQQRMAQRTRARGWGPEIPAHVMHVTKAKCAMIVSVGAHCVLPVGSRFKIYQ